jgi:6-phosphogluconolactonase
MVNVISMAASTPKDSLRAYIGTYTSGKSRGIYTALFDQAIGKLSTPELAAETKNPTFLAMHASRPVLYTVNEVNDFSGKESGAVSAFAIDPKNGSLKLINQQPSGGSGPCHLSVDQSGRVVLVANYGSGSVAVLPVGSDGALGAPTASIQHQGSSVNPERQAGPHAHFIAPDPANRFALSCDLGLDQVLVYRLDPQAATLVRNLPEPARVMPGAGPRHLAFEPRHQSLYVVNELNSTLDSFGYDPRDGALTKRKSASTLPADFRGGNSCAEVQVHPSGRFVYASNRGHNSIAVFATEPTSGSLTLLECVSTGGRTPRHFALAPEGKWLLAENQDSDNIVLFAVDSKSGRLKATGNTIAVGAPVCLVFAEATH